MGKPPRRWKGIGGKNRKIRAERKKPLPLMSWEDKYSDPKTWAVPPGEGGDTSASPNNKEGEDNVKAK